MRIDEVVRLEGRQLFEAIDSANNTGVKTENLVKMVEAHRREDWRVFESAEEVGNYLDNLVGNVNGSEV